MNARSCLLDVRASEDPGLAHASLPGTWVIEEIPTLANARCNALL